MRPKQKRVYRICLIILSLLSVFQFTSVSIAATLNPYGVESDNPYVVSRFVVEGESIDEVIVPGQPPEFYRAPVAAIPESDIAAGTKTLPNVPAFDWSYGCSATSAAMMFGYYDNMGFPNIYTGPTNGGVMPMTNAAWGKGECPLSATHQGKDGRTIKGHVDDYWIEYGSTAQDPFIGNWTEHAQGGCTGDYMGTNQSSKSNNDGSTTFYFNSLGGRLYDYTGSEPGRRDGCHGMKLFFESRGYTVNSNYSQYITGYNGNTQGFTFDDYKQEIDAGRPVLIQVEGHTMLGYGYNDTGTVVYLHDTWDYSSHQMTWGGTYSNPPMQHYGVTVFVPVGEIVATHTLTVTRSGKGTGTVTTDPAGIDCGATCNGAFQAGSTVTLTAQPTDAYSLFSKWSGCATSAGNMCTVIMTTNKKVTATFNPTPTLQLTVTQGHTNAGQGTITSDDLPMTINCGTDCKEKYLKGSVITLTAIARSGSVFKGWKASTSPCTTIDPCAVTMDKAKSVQGIFVGDYTLKIQNKGQKVKAAAGSGTVTYGASINCATGSPIGCSAKVPYHTPVTLTATPDVGSKFKGWTACPSPSGTACTLTMDKPFTVTATFIPDGT